MAKTMIGKCQTNIFDCQEHELAIKNVDLGSWKHNFVSKRNDYMIRVKSMKNHIIMAVKTRAKYKTNMKSTFLLETIVRNFKQI